MSNGIDLITLALARKGGGGGGTSDYAQLRNLPKINGTEIKGNLTSADIGIDTVLTVSASIADGDVVITDLRYINPDTGEANLRKLYEDVEAKFNSGLTSYIAINANGVIELFPCVAVVAGGCIFLQTFDDKVVTILLSANYIGIIGINNIKRMVVTATMNMTSSLTATISDLSADYDEIKETIDDGGKVELLLDVPARGVVIEFPNVTYSDDYIQFDASADAQHCMIVIHSDGTNLVYLTNIQKKHATSTITLLASSWTNNTQTVSVEGMTSGALVQVSPVPSDVEKYANTKIVCTAQGSGTLTFTCGSVPTYDIDVTVVNWG